MSESYRIAVIGGRGYTGSQLLPLINQHPQLTLAYATSGSQAGQPLQTVDPDWPDPDQCFMALDAHGVGGHAADVWVLALPNGASAPWVHAIEEAFESALIVDLGADYRFDQTPTCLAESRWVYGLTEWQREALSGCQRIANPGCYATAAQLALRPLVDLIDQPPVIFGVSGYSGAGKSPSPRNDLERLAENFMPYHLTGHVHEQEISTHLGHSVCFHPHVAPFFRGLSLTIHVHTHQPVSETMIFDRLQDAYMDARWVDVIEEIPEIRGVVNTPMARVGGVAIDARDPHQMVLVSVLDNLLKGAASQAIQNINIALGLDESLGLGAST